jgi:hypothetical protein
VGGVWEGLIGPRAGPQAGHLLRGVRRLTCQSIRAHTNTEHVGSFLAAQALRESQQHTQLSLEPIEPGKGKASPGMGGHLLRVLRGERNGCGKRRQDAPAPT